MAFLAVSCTWLWSHVLPMPSTIEVLGTNKEIHCTAQSCAVYRWNPDKRIAVRLSGGYLPQGAVGTVCGPK